MYNITACDEDYANNTPHIQRIIKDGEYSYFGNEKSLFSELVRNNQSAVSSSCFNPVDTNCDIELWLDVKEYFIRNKDTLLVPCMQDRYFYTCQPYYLLSVDLKTRRCTPFFRQPCRELVILNSIDRNSMEKVEVTYTTQISYSKEGLIIRYNRFERFMYHLKRWKGAMSIGIIVQLHEFPSFVNAIEGLFGRPIVFSVYVPMNSSESSYFVRKNGTREVFPSILYPVNILRDLAIESIRSTHFMYVDADFFISSH